jgi:putative transposase
MSFVKIWVHLVFSTKNREPWLSPDLLRALCMHIKGNCKEKDIFLQAINGHFEHLHLLLSLGKDQSIAKVAQLIKGEAAHWLNQENVIPEKFSWQDDYFAVSVSESQVHQVETYINNQSAHHASKSFQQETEEFMLRYGWSMNSKN